MAGNLSPKLSWELANPKWAATLNPVISNPIVNGIPLESITLVSGDNVINHGLGRKLQGYWIALNSAPVTFYDKQSSNPRPQLTLILNASGATTVTLYVY